LHLQFREKLIFKNFKALMIIKSYEINKIDFDQNKFDFIYMGKK